MKHRKTAKERLRLALERARGPSLLKLMRLPKSDFSDPRLREKIANRALELTDHPEDAALRAAFKQFGLDPANPFHWADLLRCLAGIVFETPVRKPRGAKLKWDEPRRMLFDTHVAMARRNLKAIVAKRGHPPLTNDLIADYLRFKWPEYYRAISAASLRQYIVTGPPGRKR